MLHLLDCCKVVKNGLYCTFVLRKQGIALQRFLICRKHCRSMKRCRQNHRSPLTLKGWGGGERSSGWAFQGATATPGTLESSELCLAWLLCGRQTGQLTGA